MVDAVGPIFAGGFQQIKAGAYELLYLPDLKNDELQREGKAPVYYWMPASVRIARSNVDSGPAKFHMIHFVGVQSGDTTVGVTGTREVAGGLLTFTTTAAPPAAQLQAAEQELLNRFRGNDDKYWGWRTSVAPHFMPMPVMSATTSLTNLSPNSDGSVPAATAPRGGVPGALRDFHTLPSTRSKSAPRGMKDGETPDSSNLDPWFINMQGQGSGAVNLLGETAYSGLMGSYPAALCWSSFHAGTGALVARQDYKLKFWAPLVEITIKGHWDKIFEHFSAAVSAHYLWAKADIAVEINNMRTNGTLDVAILVDPTIPGADKMQADIDKKTDLVLQKFMDAAQKMIFEPPPPKVDPAHADSGSGPWGVGLALKYRRDETHLDLSYHEKREMAYIQDWTISSSLGGFIDEIKADPEAEKRYFTTLYLDDWDRKVTRTIKPIVNWPDPARKWVGEPVAFLSAQIGYPDTNGTIQWTGHMFQGTDKPDAVFQPAMAKKNLADVTNPPADWKPDVTYVKRKVHFAEPPDESTYPYARIFVEQNEVDLDPGPNGTPTNEVNLELRAESTGKLDVSPISLNIELENAKQFIEVSFRCDGKTLAGNDREILKFQWNFADQNEPRIWAVYTGQLDFVPKYHYQVRVVVKGSLFTKGMEWTGPWNEANGNGPMMISVPTPEDQGVTVKREFPESAGADAPAQTTPVGPPSATAGQPPTATTNNASGQPTANPAGSPDGTSSSNGAGSPPAGNPPGSVDPLAGTGSPAGTPPSKGLKNKSTPGNQATVRGYKLMPDAVQPSTTKDTAGKMRDMPTTEAPVKGWTTVDPATPHA